MLRLWQFGEDTTEILQFKTAVLIRRTGQPRPGLVQARRDAHAPCLAHLVDILIVQDGKQPGAYIRPFAPQMQVAEPAGEAILDERVGDIEILGERACIPAQAWNFGFHNSIEFGFRTPESVGHGDSSRCLRSARGRSRMGKS